MFYLNENINKELGLHHTDDECKKPICTFTYIGWAETITESLNSYATILEERRKSSDTEHKVDIETAITTLRGLNKKDGLGLYVADSLEIGVRALERQIPNQIVETYASSQSCPICKNIVNSQYCPNCGQKLKY